MSMFVVQDSCIGCGICATDCIRSMITVEDGKAKINETRCMDCGHCIAICPVGAIQPCEPADVITEYDPASFDIPAETMLNFMKFRRSTRKFTDEPLSDRELELLLEAGRNVPTGSNLQNNRFIVLREKKEELTAAALKVLYDAAMRMEDTPEWKRLLPYREKWISLYENYVNEGINGLFFNAPAVLMVVGKNIAGGPTGELDCGIASGYLELMAASLGLGVCYIGFILLAAELDPTLLERVGLQDGEKLVCAMVVGHPTVKYHRTVRRKAVDVTYL